MRSVNLKVKYDTTDISEDISKRLISCTYNDNAANTADDISIVVSNVDNIWLNDYYPELGGILSVDVEVTNDSDVTATHFGKFSIDELNMSVNPNTFSIKAISAAMETKFKNEKNNKTFADITIKELCEQIAKGNDFKFDYKSESEHTLKEVTQNNVSDCEFLNNLVSKYAMSLKVTDQKLTIYDTPPEGENIVINGRVISLSLRQKMQGTYGKVIISYYDFEKDEISQYEYTDSKSKSNEILKVKTRAESLADAELIAKAELRYANKKAITGSISMLGRGDIFAGQAITLEDYGVYDDDYAVTKVSHNISSSGYITDIEVESI